MSEERTVFLHGVNMTEYRGYEENIYAGGFSFAEVNGFGYEVFNFSNVDGRCYGYVEITPRKGKARAIDLRKLGGPDSEESLNGVTAIWTAPFLDGRGREVVGWYRNATIHRYYKKPTGQTKQARRFRHPLTGKWYNLPYRIEADAKDCFLLHPEHRKLRIA